MADVETEIQRLYETQFSVMVRQAQYIVSSREIAEELVQEAFIRLMTKPPRETDRVGAWLRTVVNHLALDHVRRVKVEERVTEKISTVERVQTAEEATLANIDRSEVQRSLESLTSRDREALLLRHSGYSYKEIAQKLNCPAEQVGVILIRALKKLRAAYLGELGPTAREVQA